MLSTTAKRLFSSYCSHALFYKAPANASFLLHSTAPFKMNPLHIVLTYLPLKDQMAISQTCTFVHDVAAYIYSIKTTLDFSSTLTIYPTYQNDIRGKKRFVKEHAFINLPNHAILNNTRLIFQFHLLHNTSTCAHLPPDYP